MIPFQHLKGSDLTGALNASGRNKQYQRAHHVQGNLLTALKVSYLIQKNNPIRQTCIIIPVS